MSRHDQKTTRDRGAMINDARADEIVDDINDLDDSSAGSPDDEDDDEVEVDAGAPLPVAAPSAAQLHTLIVPPDTAGERIDKWLAAALPQLSRSRLRKLIDDGCVTVAAAPVVARRKVAAGDEVRIAVPPPDEATPEAEDIPLAVIFEDEHLLVIDKPAGMVVHPSAGHAGGTLVNALLHHCGESLSGINGVRRPGILHRLDIAKTDAAHRALADDLRARLIDRYYTALTQGTPSTDEGTIITHLGRDPHNRLRRAVVRPGAPDARRAETSWRVERRYHGATLLEVKLATGRTHQIRVHLAHRGQPVVGDDLYGYRMEAVLVRLAPHVAPRMRTALRAVVRPFLHARRLAFTHPATGERIELEAPLPTPLAALLAAFDDLAR
jgi:23S rRNA pseudouridine1911/1915/1917 synthase